MKGFTITIYGVCGSSAAKMAERLQYGGNTSCILVQAGEQSIVFDMGTGFAVLAKDMERKSIKQATVLLSHYHYDHIEGFPHFAGFYQDFEVDIFGEKKGDKTIQELLYGYMSQPYYPITPDNFTAKIGYHTIKAGQRFSIGAVEVKTHSTNHPGGSLAYKLCYEGKTLVYLLDHELGTDADKALLVFCQNADMLIMDAQFTDKEYATGAYKGWGHSTYEGCLTFARTAGAKAVLLTHHAMHRKDSELDAITERLKMEQPGAAVAYEGMELMI